MTIFGLFTSIYFLRLPLQAVGMFLYVNQIVFFRERYYNTFHRSSYIY